MLLKISAAGALAAVLFIASSANATPILTNGGFEGGATTSTIDGNTNNSVPTGWTPNAGFDFEPAFNHLTPTPHSGDNALSIGNFDNQPVAGLSQNFTDVVGEVYHVDFWGFAGAGGDANAFLTVSVGAASDSFTDSVLAYTQGGFSFTGTGHDVINIAAATNPSEWFVDDVSVNDTGRNVGGGPGVPEPATWAMMILGLGGAGVMLRRRRSHAALA